VPTTSFCASLHSKTWTLLGIQRVAAYVNVGNTASERVVERAGFTREGVVRSMPKPDGRRIDKTLYSLLSGE
jgi:RimJ/RimL family protein N-acetyltransferase